MNIFRAPADACFVQSVKHNKLDFPRFGVKTYIELI